MLEHSEINKVLQLLKANYNHTKTGLKYNNPFQLLISTMLSAQTTDRQVNKVTKNLFMTHPDVYSFQNLSLTELELKIKSIGLYRSKAKNILATCNLLVKRYNGKIPHSREELMKFPGIGRKIANVFLSIITDIDAIAVDTHVFRVSNRIGLAEAKDVLKTEQQLMINIEQEDWNDAHHWLIWHGRKICKARNPLCDSCFLNKHCLFFIKKE